MVWYQEPIDLQPPHGAPRRGGMAGAGSRIMSVVWIVLGSINLSLVVAVTVVLMWSDRRLPRLRDVRTEGEAAWPRVSVVVAARDEQAGIQPALESLLALDYDDYEVLVVNDRSTDGTGEILDRMTNAHTRLRVLHVVELPAGWLGKNHALWHAAREATGEYLLFTDADVVMERDALRKAIAYAGRHGIDHVAVSPDAEMPTRMLEAFVTLFISLFAIFTRVWQVENPASSAHCGIGAFNLVRRDVYRAVGTHEVIAMRPDDDLKLGKIIKAAGYRQRVMLGTAMIRVAWYTSLRDLIRGMEKNAFAGVEYRISMVVAATLALLVFDVWPFVAAVAVGGPARYLYLATVAVLWGHAWSAARTMRFSPWSVPLFPLAVLLLIYIQWRAMLLAYWNGGIQWRGTHYPLAELQANKV
jgi:cellulose synthase/poly-beta-1,6-N-acetylglucosamine synthase-like glycosyltransferase